nr:MULTISPECIES: hypothetical protein [Comamonas]
MRVGGCGALLGDGDPYANEATLAVRNIAAQRLLLLQIGNDEKGGMGWAGLGWRRPGLSLDAPGRSARTSLRPGAAGAAVLLKPACAVVAGVNGCEMAAKQVFTDFFLSEVRIN